MVKIAVFEITVLVFLCFFFTMKNSLVLQDGRGWSPCGSCPGDRTNVKITDVEPDHEYNFRVVAVNKAGPSDPSDPSETVMCKPRYCVYFSIKFRTVIFIMAFQLIFLRFFQFHQPFITYFCPLIYNSGSTYRPQEVG